jgi:type IV pilus assembly protein PilQ
MTQNRRFQRAAACLATAAALLVLRPGPAVAQLRFKEVELAVIFQTIATIGKFNVVISPQVKGRMSLQLQNVEMLEAMQLLTAIHGYKMKKVELKGADPSNKIDTYAIGRPDEIERGFETANSRTVQLKYAKADEVAAILQKGLGKDVTLGVERDPRTNKLLLKGTSEVLAKVQELVKDLDLPVPQVLIDSKIVSVNSNYTRNLGFTWNFGAGKAASDGLVAKGTAGTGGLVALTEFIRQQPNTTFYDVPNAAKGADFFRFGDFFRQNLFFNASLDVLEQRGLVRTLAAPRLLAIQGRQANLQIGDKIVFSGGPSQPPEERDTGLILEITPRVNAENFITMEIRVEQSTPRFDRADFPTIARTNTKTEVQVRDGEEVLVGGLVTESNTYNETKIPFLGDLPIIRHFFVRKSRQPVSQELVILITPHVVKPQATAAVEPTEAVSKNGAGADLGGGIDDLDLGGGGPAPGPSAGPGPRPSPGPSPAPSASPGLDDDLGL